MSEKKEIELDCGDNNCLYAKSKGGMRTNGGCVCHQKPMFKVYAHQWFLELTTLRAEHAALKEADKPNYNQCPKCKGTDQYRPTHNSSPADVNDETGTVAIYVECENCGFEYQEIYKFAEFYFEDSVS